MPVNRISRFYPETETLLPVRPTEDDLQAAYLSGYSDSEARYSANGIRAALCYVALVSGLSGFIIGALVVRFTA